MMGGARWPGRGAGRGPYKRLTAASAFFWRVVVVEAESEARNASGVRHKQATRAAREACVGRTVRPDWKRARRIALWSRNHPVLRCVRFRASVTLTCGLKPTACHSGATPRVAVPMVQYNPVHNSEEDGIELMGPSSPSRNGSRPMPPPQRKRRWVRACCGASGAAVIVALIAYAVAATPRQPSLATTLEMLQLTLATLLTASPTAGPGQASLRG